MDPPPKKKEGVTKVYPVNELPDELLLEILESIPIKDAVATEVLSKRWRSLWTGMFSANICDTPDLGEVVFDAIPIYNEQDLQRLNLFVTSIIPRLLAMNTVRISLSFRNSNVAALAIPQVRNWIDLIMNRGVDLERVHLTCYVLTDEPFRFPVLPVQVMQCETLTGLDLYGITINNFELPSLPCLKTLQLVECDFQTSACFISILHACPRARSFVTNEPIFDGAQILTHAQCVVPFTGLHIASFPKTYCHLPVHGFYNVHTLEIELSQACTELDEIPLFRNLRNLILSYIKSKWGLLLKFLNRCNNIEELTLKEGTGLVKRDFVSGGWANPKEVPHCINLTVTKCIIDGFLGEQGEKEMAIYILKHANILSTMTIKYPPKTKLTKDVSDALLDAASCDLKIVEAL